MSNLHNIKDMDTFLVEWKYLENTDTGLIVDGDVAHPINDEDDIDDINQSIKRAQNNDMKKMCGGIRRFEVKYENGEIKPLYNEDSKGFGDIIKDTEYGYYELNVSNEDIKNIFSIKIDK